METTIQPKINILLIDDDHEMREVLKSLLQRNGYEVDTAKTAAEALIKLRGSCYQLVTTDIIMPPVSGLLLIRMMLPMVVNFIVITGNDSQEHRDEAYSLGAKGYLVKPFDPNQLLQLIEAITNQNKNNLECNTNADSGVSND